MKKAALKWLLAGAVMVQLNIGPWLSPASADQTVICESNNNRRAVCALPYPGQVRVKNNFSRTDCVRGRNWDFDRRIIWVDDGCRAEFVVGAWGGNDGGGSGGGNGAAIAAAAIVGLAVGAAIMSQAQQQQQQAAAAPPPPPPAPPPPGASAPRTAAVAPPPATPSSAPGWMVGSFVGFDVDWNAPVNLTINRDGSAVAVIQGTRVSGRVQSKRLFLADQQYYVEPSGNGFFAREVGNSANQSLYERR